MGSYWGYIGVVMRCIYHHGIMQPSSVANQSDGMDILSTRVATSMRIEILKLQA